MRRTLPWLAALTLGSLLVTSAAAGTKTRHAGTGKHSHKTTTSGSGRTPSSGPGTTTTSAPAASPSPSPVPTSGSSVSTLKPPIIGLTDRSHMPSSGYRGAVPTWVVSTTWASMQPTPDGPLAANNDVDQAIALARQAGMRLRLRIRAGINAPDWVKSLGGAPVQVCDGNSGSMICGTVGRFWTQPYADAYRDLQTKLAAAYDGVPEVAEVSVTMAQTVWAEPYLRQISTGGWDALAKIGFTRAGDDWAHAEEMDIHRDVWRSTRSELAFNPYHYETYVNGVRRVTSDMPYTVAQIQRFRSELGPLAVVANHSIENVSRGTEYDEMYAAIKAVGQPISFQTATLGKMSRDGATLSATLAWAVEHGAEAVELPSGYTDTSVISLSGLANWDTSLRAAWSG
ncbi:MAG: hypothetical protein M3P23_06420 [Actinomycetota bacterium]|nr:hypothetical protein [Actinomycetota bacterium]